MQESENLSLKKKKKTPKEWFIVKPLKQYKYLTLFESFPSFKEWSFVWLFIV